MVLYLKEQQQMTNIVDRFLKYVSFDTQSDDSTGTTPSTEKQFRLAEHLVEELKSIGMAEVEMDELGYVYATLPANTDKAIPTIGFIAHMDTSPDASGENVRPRIVKNYDPQGHCTGCRSRHRDKCGKVSRTPSPRGRRHHRDRRSHAAWS